MEENAGLEWNGNLFEISMESIKGKQVEKIVERGWGFSSWIRFGERVLAWLLEGLEACYEGKFR